MLRTILGVLLIAYTVTCFLEIVTAVAMRIRGIKVILLILSVNLLTNPLANLLYQGMSAGIDRMGILQGVAITESWVQWTGYHPVWLLIESSVIVCEGLIYCKFREWIPHPWRYAVTANLISAMTGLVFSIVIQH